MSWKCKLNGHRWGGRDLVSISEVGSRGRREYFAFKRCCSNCAAFELFEERDVRHGDHVPAEKPPEWIPPVIVRRLPHSAESGERVRFPHVGGL